MSWSEKINNRKFLAGTMLGLCFAGLAGYPSWVAILTLVYVVVASALNQYFTILVFLRFIPKMTTPSEKASYKRLILDLVLKGFFLISAFICLITFSPQKVPHGLALYIFQLIILFLSIKNIGKFFNKGSPK